MARRERGPRAGPVAASPPRWWSFIRSSLLEFDLLCAADARAAHNKSNSSKEERMNDHHRGGDAATGPARGPRSRRAMCHVFAVCALLFSSVGPARAAEPSATVVEYYNAVSYTHLTLPTK